jgi:hypothetical protein
MTDVVNRIDSIQALQSKPDAIDWMRADQEHHGSVTGDLSGIEGTSAPSWVSTSSVLMSVVF